MHQVTIFFLNAVYIRTVSCPGPRCYAVLHFVVLCNKKAKAPGSALLFFCFCLGGGGGGAGLGDWVCVGGGGGGRGGAGRENNEACKNRLCDR